MIPSKELAANEIAPPSSRIDFFENKVSDTSSTANELLELLMVDRRGQQKLCEVKNTQHQGTGGGDQTAYSWNNRHPPMKSVGVSTLSGQETQDVESGNGRGKKGGGYFNFYGAKNTTNRKAAHQAKSPAMTPDDEFPPLSESKNSHNLKSINLGLTPIFTKRNKAAKQTAVSAADETLKESSLSSEVPAKKNASGDGRLNSTTTEKTLIKAVLNKRQNGSSTSTTLPKPFTILKRGDKV